MLGLGRYGYFFVYMVLHLTKDVNVCLDSMELYLLPHLQICNHHMQVGFTEEALRENVGAFVNALLLAKPAGLKKSK